MRGSPVTFSRARTLREIKDQNLEIPETGIFPGSSI
jgi:hypothetical protein